MTSSPEHAALTRAISPDRLGTYLAAGGSDPVKAVELYLWDRDLAAAILADIAILEVALRNALNDELTSAYGAEWYRQDVGFDDRSRGALARAWIGLPKDKRTPGRVVSQLMFGFWAGLIDVGGYAGKEPQAFHMDYEQLWREVLHAAFPGGKPVARLEGARFTRGWTLETVRIVHAVRNRAAHHEPMVSGLPLPGQKDKHGNPIRLTAHAGHEACMKLARLIDRDLAAWIATNSAVPATLARRP